MVQELTLKKYVNLNELIFDLTVFIILLFSMDIILPGGRKLVELYSPLSIFFIVLATSFFLMLFLSDIYRRFINTVSPVITVFIKVVFFLSITAIYMVILTFFSSHQMMPWPQKLSHELEMIFLLIPIYPIVWGLSLGFQDNFDEIKYTLYVPGTMAFIMTPLTAVFASYYFHWWLGPPVFAALIILLAGPWYIAKKITGKKADAISRNIMSQYRKKGKLTCGEMAAIEKEVTMSAPGYPVLSKLQYFWENLLFPLAAAVAIILWQKVTVEMFYKAYSNWKMQPDMNIIFWALVWSGIVPLRILSALAPPWKLLNTLLACGSLSYYIYYLYRGFH